MRRLKVFLGFFLVSLTIGASFSASYLLYGLILEKIIRVNPYVHFLITSLLGFFVFGLFINLVRIISMKFNRHKHEGIHSELLNAMSKMAQGDFNVLIKEDNYNGHKELAQGINDMAKKLGSMEKLRQDFISNVSHEIQSPLTSISGFASLLRDDKLGIEKRKHYLNIIETESKRLSKLSDNLLKLSSLENNSLPITAEEFDLDRQLTSIILMLEPQWQEKNITIDPMLIKVSIEADKDLLSQVWINLLNNAIKFTPEGGAISVNLFKDNNLISCTISDNGIGISEDDQLHIFERFFKADKARDRSLGGNGLGLSLVKKIVELHNGRITVESKLGEGTKFIIKLP